MSFKDDLYDLVPHDKFSSVWNSFFKPKNVGFFINLLKADEKSVLDELKILGVEFSKFYENFYICKSNFKSILTHCDLFNSGKIYIQNPSSFLAPLTLNAAPGQTVLDMCASPGGKSIALSNFMEKNGYLAAMESDTNRFFTLKSNLKKYNCEWVKTYNKDARSVSRTCYEKFDKILLDAPCSSYSCYNENFKEKSYKEIKNISKLQKQLLNSALNALKSGGEIVYTTCTFYKEENEEVIKNALNSKFKIQILPIDVNLQQVVKSEFGIRILPDDTMDAFFISHLIKL
ncbi:TPA: RsmB/NOP family class I SAM-dependent RNA methyltransferase [Campylobacter fetus subsp. venerealis]|nr:RsmB/NOP family class I SAM-dependent RNA methyltransferase [Campylobacter fetus subsp. venerealis]